MSLERFCRKDLITIDADESVQVAAERMRLLHVGSVIVVQNGDRVVGVITDRDIVCRVVAERVDPETTPVRDVMTEGVAVLRKTDSVDTAVHAMRTAGVRRLPVVDDDGVVAGIVTLDDLLVLLTAELGEAVHAVRDNQGP